MIGAMRSNSPAVDRPSVWPRVLPFLALAFGLSWLLDLALQLSGGIGQPGAVSVLQLQMMIPAASAILLGFLSVRYGSSKVRESSGQARLFFYFFLALTFLFVAIAVVVLAVPSLGSGLAGLGSVLALLSVLGLLVLRFAKGRESFSRAGLTFGKPILWLVYGIAVVLYYVAMAALNSAFGLGTRPDLAAYAQQSGMTVDVFLIVSVIQSVIVGPFLGIVVAFGEEYGWRGFLQSELIKLGRVRGILILGLIWGLWHAPIISMGYNYPGYPIGGIFLMTAYCVCLGFVLSYAVLKTGSIWLAAFLHALNNQVASYLMLIAYTPSDPVYQFEAGLYGLIIAGVLVVLLTRDRIWKDEPSKVVAPS